MTKTTPITLADGRPAELMTDPNGPTVLFWDFAGPVPGECHVRVEGDALFPIMFSAGQGWVETGTSIKFTL